MNEKTYHISPKKLAEADAFTARMYPESVLKNSLASDTQTEPGNNLETFAGTRFCRSSCCGTHVVARLPLLRHH
jgi:hypothetical protein